MYTETITGENNTMEAINLGDIPDFSSFDETTNGTAPFDDGWYEGTILGRRSFTDQNGNDRVFESSDAPSAKGDSRNIRLQVEIKRQTDGRTLNVSTLVNYLPEHLTQQTLQAVAKRREEAKESGEQMGDLFRPFMTLTRLAKLQKIAGVRQFQRNGDGGLDLSSLYGKKAYFRLAPDKRNDKYKEIADYNAEAPKRGKVN